MMNGIQAATGATCGEPLLSHTFWGKLAAVESVSSREHQARAQG